MKSTHLFLRRLAVLMMACLASPALGDEAEDDKVDVPATFAEAVVAGKTSLALRYRFETVDQEGFARDAEASTLRTALSYRSAPYRGFLFFVEAENVTVVGDDEGFNNAGAGSLNNGVRDRPVVADPELTEINQAYLQWTIRDTTLRVGRQAINLGNQRYVGAVAWRQHHQTFDAFSVVNKSLDRAVLSYHYLDKANRIFGDNRDMNSHLLHAEIQLGDRDKLTAYGYLLDYEEPALLGLSTSTYGLRWAGHRTVDSAKVSYTLEAAQQQDAGDNPRQVDADYLLAEVSAGKKAFTVNLGYEALSGSPEDGAFSTPLATLHKFNGWADKFLRTPANGLEDLYAGISGVVGKFGWKLIYHDFQPENGGADYGTELDVQATYKTASGITFGLKGAFYSADSFATDTDKIWFWTAWRLSN